MGAAVDWDLSYVELVGLTGTAFTIATYLMRTMIRLRIAAILSSAAFLTYGVLSGSLTVIATELMLLPINFLRLVQVKRLLRQVEKASLADFSLDWLKPLGKERPTKTGEVIFRKGDPADRLYFIAEGRFRLPESGIELAEGQIVGELALVSPDNLRTQGLESLERGLLLSVEYDEIRQLHFQSPEFGFYFLKLVSGRLFQNLAIAEERAAFLAQKLAATEAELAARS